MTTLAAQAGRAEQYIYHFSGTISELAFDNAGLIAQGGLQLGRPVEYSFLVDFQSPGYVTHYDGSTEVLADIPEPGEMGNLYVHFFFADFLGGDILRDDAAELLRPDGGWLSTHHGSYSDSAGSRMGNLVGGGVNYYVGVYQQQAGGFWPPPLPWGYVSGDPSVDQWAIGDHLLAVCSASDVNLNTSLFRAEVTLDGIMVVPEPASGALLPGALALAIGRKRRTG